MSKFVWSEGMEGVVSNRSPDKVPLFEKALVGGYLVGFAASAVSETTFTISVLSVVLMAIVVLFQESLS